jgi:hypothetical protein
MKPAPLLLSMILLMAFVAATPTRADDKAHTEMDHVDYIDVEHLDHVDHMYVEHMDHIGALEVAAPWARDTLPNARTGVGYVTIVNHSDTARYLRGAHTAVAERAELRAYIMDGVLEMRPLSGDIKIPPHEAVPMRPGGLHIMFMGLRAPLRAGDSFPLTLKFRDTADMTLFVTVHKSPPYLHEHEHSQ